MKARNIFPSVYMVPIAVFGKSRKGFFRRLYRGLGRPEIAKLRQFQANRNGGIIATEIPAGDRRFNIYLSEMTGTDQPRFEPLDVAPYWTKMRTGGKRQFFSVSAFSCSQDIGRIYH